MPLILGPRRWHCPNCKRVAATRDAQTPYHPCPALHGVVAPMYPEGMKVKVEARLREDYVGNEAVQTDADGRPVMSVVTTRDDGQDVIAFAPTARISASAKE